MDIFHHFQIYSIFKFRPFGINLDFTNISLAMLLSLCAVIVIFCILPEHSRIFKKILQIYTDFIANMVHTYIGHHDTDFLQPLISSIFLMILFGNLIGLFPHATTFTSYIIVNLCLSSFIISTVIAIGTYFHGATFILKLLIPSGVPLFLAPLFFIIEALTFFIRIPVLAGRLAINLVVGHIILLILIMLTKQFGIFVSLLYIPMFLMELFTACIQAFIFTLLSCVYLKDAVHSNH